MRTAFKATFLSLGLMAGVAFAAHAQNSGAVSALPPGGASTAGPSPVAPSGPYPGPAAGATNGPTGKVYSQIQPSSNAYPGPALGASSTPTQRYAPATTQMQDPAYAPYTKGMGPKPN